MQGIRSVEHVLRVNHAGERGAICIYRGQIAISRWRAPDCVSALTDMLAHEHAHFRTFDLLLRQRGIRHCHALALWALGGLVARVVYCTAWDSRHLGVHRRDREHLSTLT
jgi:ubiquinone biosynthesis monooxygenase Coq7